MKRPTAMLVGLAALLGAAEAWAQSEPVQIRGRRWRASLDGDFRADNNGSSGTAIDTRATLDLTDENDIDDLGAVFHFPGMGRLNIQEWKTSFTRDGVVLGQDLVFAGNTVPAGTTVNTSLDWKVTTMMMEYDPQVVPFYGLPALVSVDAGVKHVRINGQVESASSAESASIDGYLPVLGIHAKLQPVAYLSIEADINGLLLKTFEVAGGLNGTLLDAAVSAQLAYSTFYGGVGYRYFKVKIDDNRTDVDAVQAKMVIKGFFVELGVKF